MLGLELGADDYITKPFSMREFRSRVRAALRRAEMAPDLDGDEEPLERGDLRIDFAKRTTELRGEPVQLTYVEFEILAVLARHPGPRLHARHAARPHLGRLGVPRPAHDRRAHPPPAREARARPEEPGVPADGARRRLPLPRTNDRGSRDLARRSIKNRLTFLFFSITAGAILVFYFYVVPQLESTPHRSRRPTRSSATRSAYSRPLQSAIAREVTAAELDRITRAISEETGTRVTLLGIPRDEPGPAGAAAGGGVAAVRDLRLAAGRQGLDPSSATVLEGGPLGQRADRRRAPRAAAKLAQVARPLLLPGPARRGWSCSRSRWTTCEDNVDLIQRQILIAGADRAAGRDGQRLLRRERARAPREAPRARRRRGRGRQLLRARSRSTPRTSWASSRRPSTRCSAGSRGSTAPARSSSRTPRTSCARRSSRWAGSSSCSRTRTSTRTRAPSSSTTMREQVDRLQKLTTDLLDLSRLDAGSTRPRAGAGAAAHAAQTRWRASSPPRPRARTPRSRSPTASPGRHRGASATRSASPRSCGSWSTTRSSTRPTGTRITIAARREPSRGSPARRSCWSTDDGPGIGARDLPHVFERFHTGDSAAGSGLGLAIARELAQRMRGRPRGRVAAGRDRLHAHAAARRRASTPPAAATHGSAAPRCARDAAACTRAAGRARRSSGAAALAGCGGDDDSDSGGTSTVERTRVQVVEGLGGKNGFDPTTDLRPPLAGRRHDHVAVLEVGRASRTSSTAAAPARAAASCSTTTATSPRTPT